MQEKIMEGILFLCAASSVFITLSIVGVLLFESLAFFQNVPLVTFLTDTVWTPLSPIPATGSCRSSTEPCSAPWSRSACAGPLGLSAAVYLSEFASPRTRKWSSPPSSSSAACPRSCGFFALLFVTPLLQTFIPGLPGFNILSAGIVMGIMIIPYVASLSEDAMRAVPNGLRDGSLALGATRLETARVVLPSAISGSPQRSSSDLARRRRDHGGRDRRRPGPISSRPPQAAATITAYIVQVALGDLPHGSIGYQTIFAAGLTLL